MRLADCFVDLFALVPQALSDPGADYDGTRAKVESRLTESGSRAVQLDISADDWTAATFPVVAWIDETVMSSSWSGAARWRREPLQKTRFNTTKAGVEFFLRLDALPPHQRMVREVYYLCLALGFKGRYAYASDAPVLTNLQRRQLELLVDQSARTKLEEGDILFPAAYPGARGEGTAPAPRRAVSSLTISLLVTPVVVVLVLYVVYALMLHSLVERFSGLLR